MIFEFKLPSISPHATEARMECFHALPGSMVKTGSKLLDLSVDLSSSFEQDCPPISFFRIIVRENVVLRELKLARGESCQMGEVIAVFSTDATETLDQPPQRGIRVATAGIIHHADMWTGNEH